MVFSEQMVAYDKDIYSPSARKPKFLAQRIIDDGLPVSWHEPMKADIEDIKAVHDPQMVEDILACRRNNGFSTKSNSIASTLLYTNGAMITACLLAKVDCPSSALVSGFHHAEYDEPMSFCTFNGLMVAAVYLLKKGLAHRVAIIDGDYHYGNGTDHIIKKLGLGEVIWHYSYGKTFHEPNQAGAYIKKTYELEEMISEFKPDLIIYQAGADVHKDDPLGGVLDDEEIYLRDSILFKIAHQLKVPITWNLAGGYRVKENDDMSPVLDIHINTLKAAVYEYFK